MDEWRWMTSKVGSLHFSPWLSSFLRSCFSHRLQPSLITRTDMTTAPLRKNPRTRVRPRRPIAKRNQPMMRANRIAILPRGTDRRTMDPGIRPSNRRPDPTARTRERRDERQPARKNKRRDPHPMLGTSRDVTVHMARTRDTAPTATDLTTRTTTRVTGPHPSTGAGADVRPGARVPDASVMPTTSSPRVRLRTVRTTTTATSATGTAGSGRRTRPTPDVGRTRLHPRRATRITTRTTGYNPAATWNHRATRITTPQTGSSRVCLTNRRSHRSPHGRRTERTGCSRSHRSFRGPRTWSYRKDQPVSCRARAQARSCSSRLVSG